MEQQISAGVIVYIQKQNEPYFLLLHYVAGHWDFPKGHLEKGETVQQAAHRELKEETGLATCIDLHFSTKLSYVFTDPNGKKIDKTVHLFTGLVDTEIVVLSHEHLDFVWLPFDKAIEKLTYDNAKKALEKVCFFLKQKKNKVL